MKVHILVGEMGSGKSYLGKQLAKSLDYRFIEGDALAGPSMKRAMDTFGIITKEMIDALVGSIALAVRSDVNASGFVVSQALYMKRHRDRLKELLERAGFEVTFYWVKTPLRQHVRQLLSRPGGWRWIVYWLMSKPFWQKPKGAVIVKNKI